MAGTGRFTVAALGVSAARVLAVMQTKGVGSGVVGQVFETSFTVEFAGGGLVSVGAAGMDNGPLNVVCRERVASGWRSHGVAVGQAVVIGSGSLELHGGPAFDWAKAERWKAPPWPVAWDMAQLRAGLAALATIASNCAPVEGLARVAFPGCLPAGLAGAVLRQALLKTGTLGDWLEASLDRCEPPDARLVRAARGAVIGLLGLGPGLTPSGDDLLAGMLIGLHAAGEAAVAAGLATFVRDAPDDATSPFSRAHLAAAADGLPSAAMHAAVAALLEGDIAALPAAVDRLDGIGHTSGWDMLAGAVIGLRAVAG